MKSHIFHPHCLITKASIFMESTALQKAEWADSETTQGLHPRSHTWTQCNPRVNKPRQDSSGRNTSFLNVIHVKNLYKVNFHLCRVFFLQVDKIFDCQQKAEELCHSQKDESNAEHLNSYLPRISEGKDSREWIGIPIAQTFVSSSVHIKAIKQMVYLNFGFKNAFLN